jgi:hypothetical protein
MKSYVLATLIVVSLFVPTAWASDDGQTQPRINSSGLNFANTSIDIITTTNGVGNVKGVYCKSSNSSSGNVNIFVDGSAQTLAIQPSLYPADNNGDNVTGWIPLNVRFTTSIQVQLQKPNGSGTGSLKCVVSWALD